MAAGFVFAGCATYLFAPNVLRGPLAEVDPRAMRLWFSIITEHQPMAASINEFPGKMLVWLLPSCVAGPTLALWLGKAWIQKGFLPERVFYVLGGILGFAGILILQIRWAYHAESFGALALAGCLPRWLRWLRLRIPFFRHRLAPLGALMFFVLAPIPMGSLLIWLRAPASDQPIQGWTDTVERKRDESSMMDLTRALNGIGFPNKERILALFNYGPRLLYRTRHEVIGTPNHRNADGILAFYDIMNSPEDETARSLLRARGVTLIVLCPGGSERGFLEAEREISTDQTFYHRLLEPELRPAWILPAPLPPELSGEWRAFFIAKP
jgi:hypothetical protein